MCSACTISVVPVGFLMDAEVQEALRRLAQARKEPPAPAGDWQARRAGAARHLELAAQAMAPTKGIRVDEYAAAGGDGCDVPLHLYRQVGADPPGSAVVFLHGGGMIAGWHRIYDLFARSYVAASGVPMLAVHYRVAPEHPGAIPVEDCYAGLVWLADRATGLGVDLARIAVLGGSAGGGLAAGVALLAMDRGGPDAAVSRRARDDRVRRLRSL